MMPVTSPNKKKMSLSKKKKEETIETIADNNRRRRRRVCKGLRVRMKTKQEEEGGSKNPQHSSGCGSWIRMEETKEEPTT
jgi:hypothetical protein